MAELPCCGHRCLSLLSLHLFPGCPPCLLHPGLYFFQPCHCLFHCSSRRIIIKPNSP